MKRLAPVLISVALISLCATSPVSAAAAASLSALQTTVNNARAGDRVVLADGDYTTGGPITISRSGTAAAPITITAATDGGARIGGTAGFVFADGVHHVVLRGFDFRGGSLTVPPTAQANRITRNTFQSGAEGNWVTVSADDTEVDHNTFQNHTKAGVYLQVTGPGDEIAKRTWIHHNYFYNHTFGGSNGGESIRLGYSHKQSKSANAIVEYNLFEKANGDSEAVSIKSSDNIVRYNTIRNSRGFIVLRHGNRSVVEGNLLFGSGIRFHGNDHKIVNNYVYNTGAGRAIVFGSGSEADSGPTSKEHDRPDRVTVAFNTVVGTSSVIDSDGGNFKPKDCVVANNIVKGSSGKLINMTSGATVRYEGNILWGATAGIPSGFRSVDPKLAQDANGLYRLAAGSPAIDTSTGGYPYAGKDFDLQTRSGTFDVGADEYTATAGGRKALTTADVGPKAP
jgi:hypothetical protein